MSSEVRFFFMHRWIVKILENRKMEEKKKNTETVEIEQKE